jgi:hypothetical protein
LNSGKYVSAAMRQPARMIFFRPIRSDSAPNTRKNGVPSASDSPMSTYAGMKSSLR